MKNIKDKFSSSLGSILEWYDFALYGFFAKIISDLYFPNPSQTIAIIQVFSVFSIGFLSRPIGALIFGRIADKHGRTASLKLTPILITIPTICISFLPTYEQIGICAPIFFIILRILQGICVGGEFTNNIIYLCETSKPKNTFFYGSIGSCTGSIGILLASTVSALTYSFFPKKILLAFGWRIPFLLGGLIGIVAYILRKNMSETPVFNLIKNKKNNFTTIELKKFFIAVGITFLPATSFYYIFVFLPNFLQTLKTVDYTNILEQNSLFLFLRLAIIPIIGLLADRLGGLIIARVSCLLFLTLSYTLMLNIVKIKFINLSIIIFALLSTLNAGTTPGLLVKLLKPDTRSTLLSFAFNFSFGIFGGIVPTICFLLIDKFNNSVICIYYLIFSAFVTLISTFFIKEKI